MSVTRNLRPYTTNAGTRDFNAPLIPSPRPADSSAAMIATNGLFLLADQELSVSNVTGAAYYTNAAIKVGIAHLVDNRRNSAL